MATSGDLHLAINEDFLMAMDTDVDRLTAGQPAPPPELLTHMRPHLTLGL
jgi:hypothetical protein